MATEDSDIETGTAEAVKGTDNNNSTTATAATTAANTNNDNQSTISLVPPNRPASTASSVTSRVLELDPETISQLESPGASAAAEEDEDDDEGNAGYEESAERDEIIRERINRTQEQMR